MTWHFFRCIPGMTIASPLNEVELRNMMYTAQLGKKGPMVIRYPRGRGVMVNWKQPFRKLEIGNGQQLKDGSDLAILSLGPIGNHVTEAISPARPRTHQCCSLRHAVPQTAGSTICWTRCSPGLIRSLPWKMHPSVGGLGSAVIEFMNDKATMQRNPRLGIPDRFVDHGTQEELYSECGYDAAGIAAAAGSYGSRSHDRILTRAV